jgi:heptaprenyl diphosphate synthase
MRKSSNSSEKTIERALLDLIESGGKLLRPAFVLLGGRFGEYDQKKHTTLGAVVEMLHMATLVHDDIVDDAVLRRGRETIQSKYGKNYAVFMGDFLFSRCFTLLSNNTSMENMRMLSKVISKICVGEIEQFSSKFDPNVSTKKYLKRIDAKTATLFSISLSAGAVEAGCDKMLANKLGRIGHNIGMAFQIIDDILDYTGEQGVVGKPVCNDLKQGIYTLPLIHALEKDNGELKELLDRESYSDEEIRQIIATTEKYGGVEWSRKLALEYTEKAFKGIKALRDNEAKRILNEVTEKLLIRNY